MTDAVTVQTTTDIKVDDSDRMIKVNEHKFKDIFCSGIITFSCVIIGYVVLFGDGKNSLHESAMSWSFFMILSILAGYGLGSLSNILPNLPSIISRK